MKNTACTKKQIAKQKKKTHAHACIMHVCTKLAVTPAQFPTDQVTLADKNVQFLNYNLLHFEKRGIMFNTILRRLDFS